MSEKRFSSNFYEEEGRTITCNGNELTQNEVVDLLNEQQDTIITLRRRLEKINGGYGHLTHRNGLTANEWLIESQERELKKKNEEISDWIERHSKDIAKIGEQKSTISQLEEENEQLKEENKKLIEEWEFSFRTEMAHHRFAEKELQEKIREKQATIKSKDKQLERLYNYFQDYLKDEMSSNSFSEMWDFVKEDEKWEDE